MQNRQRKKIKKINSQNSKKLFYIAGIILLSLAFFGCTEMSRSEKNVCYSLTTKSYSYIPACETENSCFEKVNSLFKTQLNYSEESKLYEIKNHVARSWFYYNKSIKEFENI